MRTSASYWKERVEKVPGTDGILSPNYSARIAYQGRRVRFPLSTPNKDAAAAQAAKIFRLLIANGWEQTIAEFKPQTIKKAVERRPNTVGDLIRTATALSTARPQTKQAYAKAFRRVVAGVAGLKDGRKYDGTKGGFADWREAVDAVRLDTITPARVIEWKNRYLESAGGDPTARQSAKTTVNSLIRNSKSLFAAKFLPFLAKEVALPDPLPFHEVPMEKPPSMRYRSRVDAKKILADAQSELVEEDPEAYKALLLALVCGLRISEIDHLLWEAFDFDRRLLRVEHTQYHQLKSEDSAGEIDLDDSLVAQFRGFHARSRGRFVVSSPAAGRRRKASRHYRCDDVFNRLRRWLRTKKVKSKKPIHELRKEIGSIIAAEHGIFEASRYLRHSDIRITAAIYVDKKKRVTPNLDELSDSGQNPTAINHTEQGGDGAESEGAKRSQEA